MTAVRKERVRALRVDLPSPDDMAAIDAMRRIIDEADVFVVEGRSFIVAPIFRQDVDALAAFDVCEDEGAIEDDDDGDPEEEPDREPDADSEANGDEWDGTRAEDEHQKGELADDATGQLPESDFVTGYIAPIAEYQRGDGS